MQKAPKVVAMTLAVGSLASAGALMNSARAGGKSSGLRKYEMGDTTLTVDKSSCTIQTKNKDQIIIVVPSHDTVGFLSSNGGALVRGNKIENKAADPLTPEREQSLRSLVPVAKGLCAEFLKLKR